MKLGFIGAGKVGTTLAKYLAPHHTIIGFTSHFGICRAQKLLTSPGRARSSILKSLSPSVIPCSSRSPDGQIETVWNEILASDIDLQGKNIAHCSGALSSEVFAGREERGAFGYSVHPLFAVPSASAKPVESSIRRSSRSKAIRNTLWKWSLSSPMKATWFK